MALIRRLGQLVRPSVHTFLGLTLGVTLTVGAINMNATLKLIEKVNAGPFAGMILHARDAACVTVINGSANRIENVCANRSEGRVAAQVTAIVTTVPLENGGFENGLQGWGTGFYESFFRQSVAALRFGGAVASWKPDEFPYKGRSSLRVKHESDYAPNVFSSLSQLVKVEPGHRFEVRFWAYLKASDKNAFALRIIPSRVSSPEEWERYKTKLDSSVIGQWQQVRSKPFESGVERFWDLRFTAEAPMTVWVDEVSVTDLGPVNPR